MKLEVNAYTAYCALEVFKINGESAYEDDFGEQKDLGGVDVEDYCCGNMQFIPKPATQEVLDKYGINVDEYNEVCKKLDCLSFGSCHWCS